MIPWESHVYNDAHDPIKTYDPGWGRTTHPVPILPIFESYGFGKRSPTICPPDHLITLSPYHLIT